MASGKGQQQAPAGPWAWENSRAKRNGKRPLGTVEIGCYTDLPELWKQEPVRTSVCTFLTPLSLRRPLDLPEGPRLGVVLRVDQYLDSDGYVDRTWEQLDPRNYHGATAAEELAALVSLALGMRLRAGGIIRVFGPESSEAGDPHEMDPPPYLPRPARYGSMLPEISGLGRPVDYSRLDLLNAYAGLSAGQARALVRSARSYQEAVWVADSDPRQAWLRLVTAVEAVADLQPKLGSAEKLRLVYPEMVEQILACGNPGLVDWFTAKIANREGATAKFLAFLTEFGPPRPRRRPRNPADKQDWSTLDYQLRSIYRARSDDLHNGSPIPRSMCEVPVTLGSIAPEVTDAAPGEQPRLRLHVFEYIVRNAVLSWWRSVSANALEISPDASS